VSTDQLELAGAFLRLLPVATAASFLVGLLILRSVFRRDTLAKIALASLLIALLAFVVPAIAAFIAAAGLSTGGTSYDLEESFGRKLPLMMAASFAITLTLLRWRLRQEDWAKLIFASVLVALFACAIPFMDMLFYVMELKKWSVRVIISVFTWRMWVDRTFAPWLLLFVVWLVAVVRHSPPREKSYTVEAATAVILGACLAFWTGYQTGAIAID
jgi:hypothetical protein